MNDNILPEDNPESSQESTTPAENNPTGQTSQTSQTSQTDSTEQDPGAKPTPMDFVSDSTSADKQKRMSSSYEPIALTGEALLFDPDRALHEDSGRELPKWDIQRVEEFSTLFSNARGGIITAEKREEALEVAACASYRKRYAHRYHSTHADIVSIEWSRLESCLRNRPHPTCYILEYWTWPSTLSILSGWTYFLKAVRALEGTGHSIILCVDPASWDELEARGKAHDGLVPYRRLPDPATAHPDGGAQAQAIYQNIFTPAGKDLREILLAADRQIIGKTLVQLALLFPDLSTANYERLLKAILAGRTVLVTPAEGTTPEYRPSALTLWSSARHVFLEEAGLDRRTMTFKSKELQQEAEEMAWAEEQAMFEVFAAVSREGPLFGDLTDTRERELNLAYLNAAVVMADRAPSSFGPKWLEALVTDLHKQAKLKIPDFSGDYPELMLLLTELADNRQQLLNRFAERVALLADYLIDAGKGTLVTDLLSRLRRNRLHDISLRIISQIRRISDAERISSLKNLLNHGDQKTKTAALRGFAVEYLADPGTKMNYLLEIRDWLENDEHAYNANLRPAAQAFPAVFLEICHSSLFSKNRTTITADRLFDQIESSPPLTLLDWLGESIIRKDFGALAARYMPQIDTPDPDVFLLAMTLYYLAAMPDDGRTEVLDLVRKVRTSHLISVRSQLRSHWKDVAEHWARVEKKTTGTSRPEVERAALAKRLRTICQDLIRN